MRSEFTVFVGGWRQLRHVHAPALLVFAISATFGCSDGNGAYTDPVATTGGVPDEGSTSGADAGGMDPQPEPGDGAGDTGGSTGDPDDPRDLEVPWRSGSRLRVQTLGTTGGAVHFAGFWDAQLEVECQFREKDGAWRCLPRYLALPHYGDDRCTEPVVAPLPCLPTPEGLHVTHPGRGEMCPSAAGYTVGERHNGPVWSWNGTQCVLHTSAQGTYRQLLPVPDETFVAGTRQEVVVSDEVLRAEVIAADDGAHYRRNAIDPEGRTCSLGAIETAGRCVPAPFAPTTGYADPACTERAALGITECGGEAPTHALVWASGGCEPPAIHRVGDPVAEGYIQAGDECVPFEDSGTLFEIEEAMDPRTLPPMQTVPVGDGPVVAQWFGGASGEPLLSTHPAFYDETLDMPCAPEEFVDGVTRCIPRSAQPAGMSPLAFFSDARCQTPLRWHPLLCGSAGEPLRAFVDLQPLAMCGSRPVAVFRAIAHNGEVYRHEAGQCVPHDPDPAESFYAIGPDITDQLAIIELVVD